MEELSKQEAAEYLGVSLRTLERYIKKNLIAVKYVKSETGRRAIFFKSELDELNTRLNTESFKPTIEEEKGASQLDISINTYFRDGVSF
jgi:excisionase family DNA binding protein